ncbi:MAG TPA: hypothetical protein VFS00_02130, partial [Polyangiaceae bacterium]|nr:hypothetical protein [Polyangiaceae bacterium]
MAERSASLAKAPPYRQTARPTPSWVGTRLWLPPDAASGLLAPGELAAPSYVVFALAWFALLLAGASAVVLLAGLCVFVLMLLIACSAPTSIEFEREGICVRWLFLRRRWYFADMAAAELYARYTGEGGVTVRMRRGEVHSFPTVIVARSGG